MEITTTVQSMFDTISQAREELGKDFGGYSAIDLLLDNYSGLTRREAIDTVVEWVKIQEPKGAWVFDPQNKWPHISKQKIMDSLGHIPSFLRNWNEGDKLSEVLNDAYTHGGGWRSMPGWSLDNGVLRYPSDDPEDMDDPSYPIVERRFGTETFRMYPRAWVSIQQIDGTFEVSRMD